MYEKLVTLFVTDCFDFHHGVRFIHIIEDAKITNSQFPFRQLIGAQLLSVARKLGGLTRELTLDGGCSWPSTPYDKK